MRHLSAAGPPLLLVAVLLGVWELACRALQVPAYLLPAPSAIGVALVQNAPVLAVAASRTLGMALQALIAASLFASVLALGVTLSRTLDLAVRPLAVALQVTPVVAIAPLFVIWAGVDHPQRAIIALAAIVATFRSSPARPGASLAPIRIWSACSISTAQAGSNAWCAFACPPPSPSWLKATR